MISFWVFSSSKWCIDVVQRVKIIFRYFEILHCVLIPVKLCYDMILIWYLYLITRRWSFIWFSLCMMIVRFPRYSAITKISVSIKWLHRVHFFVTFPSDKEIVNSGSCIIYYISTWSMNLVVLLLFSFRSCYYHVWQSFICWPLSISSLDYFVVDLIILWCAMWFFFSNVRLVQDDLNLSKYIMCRFRAF